MFGRYGTALPASSDFALTQPLSEFDIKIVRAPGPMKMAPGETAEREIIAFIEDPDGYKIELIQAP